MKAVEFTEVKESVKVDSKGRIILGAEFSGKNFSVSRNRAGELLLIPVVMVHEQDTWLYEHPEAFAQVKRGLADVAAGRVGEPIDFSKYADTEEV